MCYPLITTLIVLSWTTCVHAEDAKQFFDSIYGNRVKQVKATADRADDLALAKEILAAAQSLERADAVGLMCDSAIDLSQRHPEGLSTAIDALRLIDEKIEARRAEARKKMVELLTRLSATGSAEAKQRAADELIALLVDQGDEAAEAKKYDEAQASYRAALAAAQRVKSPEIDAVKAKMEWAGNRGRVEKQIARLREKLLADANDFATAEELIRLHLVDMDSPAEALKFVDRAKDPKLTKLVPLAAKPVREVPETNTLELGSWYLDLAATAGPSSKGAMWRRGAGYLTIAHDSQAIDELGRTKADLLLKSIHSSYTAESPKVTRQTPDEISISKDATHLPLNQLSKVFSGLDKFTVKNGVAKGRAGNSDVPGLPELKTPIEGKTFRFGLKMKAPSHQIIFGRANGQVFYYSRGVGDNEASRVMGNKKGPVKLEGTVENPKDFALLEVEYDGRKVHYYYNGKAQYSDDIWDPTGEKKSFSFGFSSHLNDIEVKDVYLLIDGQSAFKK